MGMFVTYLTFHYPNALLHRPRRTHKVAAPEEIWVYRDVESYWSDHHFLTPYLLSSCTLSYNITINKYLLLKLNVWLIFKRAWMHIKSCRVIPKLVNGKNKYIAVHFTTRATIIVWSVCKCASYKELEYCTRRNIWISTVPAQLALAAHSTHSMSQNCYTP